MMVMMMSTPRYVKPRCVSGVSGLFFAPGALRSTTLGGVFSTRRAKKLGFEIGFWSVPLITLGRAAHVPDVALARVLRRHRDPGRGAVGERVLRDRAQVPLAHQLLERRWVLA